MIASIWSFVIKESPNDSNNSFNDKRNPAKKRMTSFLFVTSFSPFGNGYILYKYKLKDRHKTFF